MSKRKTTTKTRTTSRSRTMSKITTQNSFTGDEKNRCIGCKGTPLEGKDVCAICEPDRESLILNATSKFPNGNILKINRIEYTKSLINPNLELLELNDYAKEFEIYKNDLKELLEYKWERKDPELYEKYAKQLDTTSVNEVANQLKNDIKKELLSDPKYIPANIKTLVENKTLDEELEKTKYGNFFDTSKAIEEEPEDKLFWSEPLEQTFLKHIYAAKMYPDYLSFEYLPQSMQIHILKKALPVRLKPVFNEYKNKMIQHFNNDGFTLSLNFNHMDENISRLAKLSLDDDDLKLDYRMNMDITSVEPSKIPTIGQSRFFPHRNKFVSILSPEDVSVTKEKIPDGSRYKGDLIENIYTIKLNDETINEKIKHDPILQLEYERWKPVLEQEMSDYAFYIVDSIENANYSAWEKSLLDEIANTTRHYSLDTDFTDTVTEELLENLNKTTPTTEELTFKPKAKRRRRYGYY